MSEDDDKPRPPHGTPPKSIEEKAFRIMRKTAGWDYAYFFFAILAVDFVHALAVGKTVSSQAVMDFVLVDVQVALYYMLGFTVCIRIAKSTIAYFLLSLVFLEGIHSGFMMFLDMSRDIDEYFRIAASPESRFAGWVVDMLAFPVLNAIFAFGLVVRKYYADIRKRSEK